MHIKDEDSLQLLHNTFPFEEPVTTLPPRRSNDATMFSSGCSRNKKTNELKHSNFLLPLHRLAMECACALHSLLCSPVQEHSSLDTPGIYFCKWSIHCPSTQTKISCTGKFMILAFVVVVTVMQQNTNLFRGWN